MRTASGILAVLTMAIGASVAGTVEKFEMMKKLEGEWVEVKNGVPTERVMTRFRLTAAGTALEETVFEGGMHEMMTLYHLDGDDLVLTHYCINGNQPRMQAEESPEPMAVVFKCAGGANITSEDDKHMHRATIVWKDDDHIRTEWQEFEDGKSVYTATFDLARK